MEEEEKKSNGILDKTIDFMFSNDKRKWLVLIFILGIVLRFIFVRNISALGDEMVHGPHAIGFLHSGLISTIAHSPLWFYLTDLAHLIFGVTMFSSRFLSFFYGSITIILIYLISSKVFSRRVGILSAFVMAISYYHIRFTLMEMDVALIFFMLLAAYSFILSMEKGKFPYLAAIAIGVAALIKTLSLFFVPAFIIGFFIFNNKAKISENIKKIIWFGLIIMLIFSPILIHNYLWYKDKGMVDIYFAQYFVPEVRPNYADQAGYDSGFLYLRFFEGVKTMSVSIFKQDPLIVPLGVLGFIFAFGLRNKRKYWWFLVAFQLSGFIFLILSNWLTTHYSTMSPLLALFAGFFIDRVSRSFKEIDYKKVITVIIIILLGFQLYMLWPHLSSRAGISQMRDYAINSMDTNSIVVVDSRIYRGRIVFMFHDFHYIESSFFPQVYAMSQNISGEDIPMKVYFIECVPDDCGWGTVGNGPLNDSSEQIVESFKSIANPEKIIYGGGGYGDFTGEEHLKVYSTTIGLKREVIPTIDSTHSWFYYPVNYEPKEQIYDIYDVNGSLDNLIYKFAWLITILSIIIAILLAFYPFYKIYKES
ncbi:MAG: glycosyltransferase family 39 protein [Nanoarchaeota archaeon]|nr:glycosyltransferase family 39 protein [Nanoarchaeota archaeon]